MHRQLLRNAFDNQAVAQLENRARQLLNMPQAAPVVGPTGQASRIDQAIRQQRAANQAGADMRYDTYEYTEPARTEFGDGLFTFDEYIPERTDVSITERPEVMRAFGEQSLDDYMERPREPNRYQSKSKEPVRKAGLDVDNAGLSKKDMKTIDAAKDVISKHMATLGGVGLGVTGAGILANGFAVDGDSQDNLQDAAVASGLLGLGGYSGYAAGANTYAPMSEALAVRRQEAGDTTPIQGRVFARDAKRRDSRGRTGAVVGAGAGALLGLIKAYEQDEQQLYPSYL